MLKQLKKSNTIIKNYRWLFVQIFFRNYFFMFFSFCNCFLPIAICFIAAYGPTPRAVDYVLAVGMITGFMISFYQLGFVFSLTMLNISSMLKLKDKQFSLYKREQFLAQEYLISFLVGLVLMGLYCGICYGYVKYSGGYVNTHIIAENGFKFAYATSPTILLSLLSSMTLFNVFAKLGNFKATLIVISQLVINLFFVALVGLLGDKQTDLGIYGYAIGLDVGMLLNLIIIFIIAYISWIRIIVNFNLSIIKNFYKLFLPMLGISLVNTWTVLLRVFIILAISLKFHIDQRDALYNLMFAKIFYFFAVYALIFIGNGATYTLAYMKVYFAKYPNLYIMAWNTNWIIPAVLTVITSLITIMFYFTMPYLFQHFIIHAAKPDNAYTYLAWNMVYNGRQVGVAGFIAMPYNMSIMLTCIAVVAQTAAFSLDLFPNRENKAKKSKKNKKTPKPALQFFIKVLPQLLIPLFVIGFVIGFGLGTMNKGPFQFLAAFATPYLIFSLVILFLRFVVAIIGNLKLKRAEQYLNPCDLVTSYFTLISRYRFKMFVSKYNWPIFWNQLKKGIQFKQINH